MRAKTSRAPARRPDDAGLAAARLLHAGAAALSFSVVADSAAEHYRGGFYNPAMFVGPTVSGLTLAASATGKLRRPVLCAATLTGLAGTGFHVFNLVRRTDADLTSRLFHGAPAAAPFGITAAGLCGLAAERLAGARGTEARVLGVPLRKLLAFGAAAGLVGTAAEAGILHFRGAFNRREMYLPVTLPPAAAAALAIAAARPTGMRLRTARALLLATAALGMAGVAFHARGIARRMGGWRNWSQNLLAGPPLPAPPAFTGMALAGLAAVSLLEPA